MGWMNARFGEAPSYDIPSCPAELQAVVEEYRQLFSTVPGFTDLAHHTIPTASTQWFKNRGHVDISEFRETNDML